MNESVSEQCSEQWSPLPLPDLVGWNNVEKETSEWYLAENTDKKEKMGQALMPPRKKVG